MADYPDPDEEYELMYGDDLDVLREHEGTNKLFYYEFSIFC